MGWWNATRDGSSLIPHETGLMWGDEAADILDDALERISELFDDELGRDVTTGELRAGLEFALAQLQQDDVNFQGRFLM